MQRKAFRDTQHPLCRLATAGLAGALAEVVWVASFCAASGRSTNGVLREISATVLGGSAHAAWAPAAGIIVHFALGVLIALAFGVIVREGLLRGAGPRVQFVGALVGLAMVWAINFFVLLPVLNPAFVTIVPLSASLVSKLLFGVAMALTLDRAPLALLRGHVSRALHGLTSRKLAS
jgi:hypothetical protein